MCNVNLKQCEPEDKVVRHRVKKNCNFLSIYNSRAYKKILFYCFTIVDIKNMKMCTFWHKNKNTFQTYIFLLNICILKNLTIEFVKSSDSNCYKEDC